MKRRSLIKFFESVVIALMTAGGLTACGFRHTPDFKKQLSAPENVYLEIRYSDEQTDYVLTWDAVENATRYSVYIDGEILKNIAKIYKNECDLTAFIGTDNTYKFGVTAIGNGKEYSDSECSVIEEKIEEVTQGLKYEKVGGGYEVSRGSDILESASRVVLPDVYEGADVKRIAKLGAEKKFQLYYRPEMRSVRFPRNLTCVGELAFVRCEKLKKIVLPEKLLTVEKEAFIFCSELTEVVLPESLEYIGEKAFGYCKNITEIDIPKNVGYIGDFAFGDCENLENINVQPKNFDFMGRQVFENTAWYENQPDGFICLGNVLYRYKGEMAENTVLDRFPENITKFAGEAFFGCGNLAEVVIPDGWTTVTGEYVFSKCGLRKIKMPESMKVIEAGTFCNCSFLESIEIPKGVVKIGDWAFNNCVNLDNIILPENLTELGNGAFADCSRLANITFPERSSGLMVSTFSIGQSSFRRCDGLTDIVLPKGLDKIATKSFLVCENLAWVVIPRSVKVIEAEAFSNCDSLKVIFYEGTKKEWGQATIASGNDSLKNATIYFYSEIEPPLNRDGTAYDGDFWRYGADGVPMAWTKEEI